MENKLCCLELDTLLRHPFAADISINEKRPHRFCCTALRYVFQCVVEALEICMAFGVVARRQPTVLSEHPEAVALEHLWVGSHKRRARRRRLSRCAAGRACLLLGWACGRCHAT